MKKKKKFPVFLVCYLCFFLACALFWVFVIRYVNECLVRFEAAQPERIVERVMGQIQQDGASSVFPVKEAFTQFEPLEFLSRHYDESVAGKTIVWRQDKVNYNPSEPVYRFYADEEPIGTLTLRETSSEQLMFLLSLSEWEVASAEPVLQEGHGSVTVTVPDSYTVMVNGLRLGAEETTGNAVVPEQFKYAKEYVPVPELVEYQVQGLLEKPTVEILDAAGSAVGYDETYEAGQARITIDEFPVTEMPSELSEKALENAKRYTNFQSEDLPGCHASTDPIADMFPKDSIYMEQAEQYRREDMWMYNNHAAPVFKNESVSNYVRYTDELFSCDVYFDKHMVLVRDGSLKIDTFHMRLFYGLLDGGWKILDMQTILDNG